MLILLLRSPLVRVLCCRSINYLLIASDSLPRCNIATFLKVHFEKLLKRLLLLMNHLSIYVVLSSARSRLRI